MSKTFGELLAHEVRECLDSSLMTQRELAEESFPDRKIDSAERRVREILQGKHKNPTPRTYLPICDTLNITRETIRAMKRDASDAALQDKAERQDFEADAGPIPKALDHPEGLTRAQLVFLAELFGADRPEEQSDSTLRGFLTQKAEEYRAVLQEVQALRGLNDRIDNIHAAALGAIEAFNLKEARDLLAGAREILRQEKLRPILEQNEKLMRAQARVELLDGDPDSAFAVLSAAADSYIALDPLEPAKRRLQLENILHQHGERYGGPGLALSQRMIETALSTLSETGQPQLWADAKNRLGRALQTQGSRIAGAPGAARLAEAAESYRAALRVTTEADHPLGWAMTMQNLGAALQNQGSRIAGAPGAARLAEAAESYRAALRVTTEADHPLGWAMTMQNLGAALQTQGSRVAGAPGAALLAEAAESYRAALRVTHRGRPSAGLGHDDAEPRRIALQAQGSRIAGAPGAALLAEAADSYRTALRVFTEADHPLHWAGTMQNLGNALATQGIRIAGEPGAALLAKAADSYRAALRVRTEADHPLDWAMTMQNLGNALQEQGSRIAGAPGAALLAEAAESYRAALRVTHRGRPSAAMGPDACELWASRRRPCRSMTVAPIRPRHLRAAIAHMDAALTVFDESTGFYHEDSTRRRAAMVDALAALDG